MHASLFNLTNQLKLELGTEWNYFLIVQQTFIKSKRSRLCGLTERFYRYYIISTDYKQNRKVKPNDELPEEEGSKGYNATVTNLICRLN